MEKFKFSFRQVEAPFSFSFDAVVGSDGRYETYDGTYIVTPRVEAQSLPTAKRNMKEDVTVKAIPYAEVSNDSNGKTVTIG